jgi:hypothetical protein
VWRHSSGRCRAGWVAMAVESFRRRRVEAPPTAVAARPLLFRFSPLPYPQWWPWR